MNIRSVAIILNDNDFGSTFRNLLETIGRVIYNSPDIPEADIEEMILEGIRFHYIAFQNQYQYKNNGPTYEDHFADTVEHLVTGIKIYFNHHAELKYENEDHNYGAWILNVDQLKVDAF